jgi:dTMP kinase
LTLAMVPRFITFEGIDGSGKSSHLARAARWLERHGVPHLCTKEPGGTPLGDELRRLFLHPRWGALDGTVELLMLFASRRQHLLDRIEPALAAGNVVLCDRFTDSTLAYQGSGRGVSLALIGELDRLATGGRRPDRTLLFDLPAAAARARRHGAARSGRTVTPGAALPGPPRTDRLDAEDLAFYDRVRRGFLALAEREPARFRVIDSSGEPARTGDQVRAALADLLPAGGVRA